MYKTNNSKLLIDIFEQNKDKSYQASYLVEELKDKMNKATIYRQLKSLESESYLSKTYNNETKAYEYQISSDCRHHLHLKCTKCGHIVHLKCHQSKEFVEHILADHGFSVDQYASTIYGVCKECGK